MPPKSRPHFKLQLALSFFTHEEREVEETEDVFGARGAAVGHHDEVDVPIEDDVPMEDGWRSEGTPPHEIIVLLLQEREKLNTMGWDGHKRKPLF